MSALNLKIHRKVDEVPSDKWNRLNLTNYPFIQHSFLDALEKSNSVGPNSGWAPVHLGLWNHNELTALLPAYIKYHSYGEYVFDQSWAHAFEQAGGRYYPKLLSAIPFTPVTGPRLLSNGNHKGAKILISALEDFTHQYALSSRKRKSIKKERLSLQQNGVQFYQLTGDEIRPEHWRLFYRFYRSTVDKKFGGAYLTEAFFTQIGLTMADKILLVIAKQNNQIIAGALNFIGYDKLYGRHWGCAKALPNLHFETCYYQAIDFAINRRLDRVEAGAGGSHKLQRGYMPAYTYSAHYLRHDGFADAVKNFLDNESRLQEANYEAIIQASPYKK